MHNPNLQQLKDTWLPEATIEEIQKKLASNDLTSRELVLMYLDQIGTYNQEIQAVLEVNPDALQIAESLDVERKQFGARGPLHGVPVLIKDNIATKDKMHTSAGSLALATSYAKKDAFVVQKLREAGAIILGKTNMTEWANFMTEGMPSGYSSRGGQVKNPYGRNFDCGGSSSGSGASVAANFASFAIGTETSGSILSPASQNSLVGIKPTVGLISRSGIIPISHTQDTAGPMTRTVKDAAYVLNAITGFDENDPITRTNESGMFDYTSLLEIKSLAGMKIGIARDFYFQFLSEEKRSVINKAIDELSALGAEVVDVTIPSTEAKWTYHVLTYEFKAGVNAYLNEYAGNTEIQSLTDIIHFNFSHPDSMLKYGQKILLESENTSGTLTESDYLKSIEMDQYLSKENGIDYAIGEFQLDAILFPNNFGAGIPAKAGYPSVTVPAGYTPNGEPVGITFTGTAFTEAKLIHLAYEYEQATKHRKPPVLEKEKKE
ncbi:amidase family protein [Evansella tamaricis]|uniref:Amidase n=1 Tax=Evansella tamaricis TaxID=2069301 RepID=A0ABS6JEC2_9BACI|nr:amidase [Evansella tamaricis]